MKNKEIIHGQTPETFYRVSVKAILRNDKGKMLAIKEGNHEPLWELPGGGLDHGETTIEGLKRELAEELGIENELTATIASITSEYYPLKDYWKLFVTYDVTVIGDYKIKMLAANEVKWMPVVEYNKSKHPVEPAVDEARTYD